jgi:redox-sensitive bicupin YhaK (pirin superfamily)
MTAAGGILHEEFHSPAFTRRGGALEMVQLWVNLPARHKMSPPRYQTIVDGDIPQVQLPAGAGMVRVIAGAYGDTRGPAATFSPLNVWDVRLSAGRAATWTVPAGHTGTLAVLRGQVTVNGSKDVAGVGLVMLATAGEGVEVQASSDSVLLFLSGEPISEPIVGYGPFVMNTREEIQRAISDFQSGRFGRMPPRESTTAVPA